MVLAPKRKYPASEDNFPLTPIFEKFSGHRYRSLAARLNRSLSLGENSEETSSLATLRGRSCANLTSNLVNGLLLMLGILGWVGVVVSRIACSQYVSRPGLHWFDTIPNQPKCL